MRRRSILGIVLILLLAGTLGLGAPLTYSPEQPRGPKKGPEIDRLRFQVLEDPIVPPPDEVLYVNNFTAEDAEWNTVGAAPYLDAIDDSSYIEGTFDNAYIAWFGFEDATPGNATIKRVELEGYTNGPYNDQVDYDVYTQNYTWLGSLYATGESAWVTPRRIGLTVDEVCSAVLTEEGLNSLLIMLLFYDPYGYNETQTDIVDALRLKVWYTEWTDVYTRRTEAMQNRTIDTLTDLVMTEQIDELGNSSFTVISAPAFHMGHVGFNIRANQSYRTDRPSGELPYVAEVLSDVNFRHAILHSFDQENIIQSILGDIVMKCISLVPPAETEWQSPTVPEHPYNPGDPFDTTMYNSTTGDHEDSCSILRYAGYTFVDADSSETVTAADYWTKNGHSGDPLPTIRLFSPTYEQAPTTAELGNQLITSLNKIGLNNMELSPVDFSTYISSVFDYGEFDMYMVFWMVQRFPDHLYNMLHSSQDSVIFPGGDNAPGVNDSYVDTLLEIFRESLNYSERLEVIWEVQDWIFNPDLNSQALPYLQLYSRVYFGAFNPGLRGIVESPGYHEGNTWTFLNMHWEQGHPDERTEDGNSTVIWCLSNAPESFTPLSLQTAFDSRAYGWEMLAWRTFDPLIAVDPWTHEDLSWLADSWEMVETAGGMNITFWLNSTVEWQDGNPYTTEDAQFNWLFLRDNQIPTYSSMWQNLVDVEILTPGAGGVVRVILNVTSPGLIYDLASTAALLPPSVWGWLDGKPQEEILAYDPSVNTTKPTGAGPRFGMADGPQNQLYGTGPYIFQFYEQVEKYADLYANRYYWKTADAIQSQLVEMFWACGDVDQNGVIDQTDQERMQSAYGSTPGDGNWDLYCDLNQDSIVDDLDMATLNFYFGNRREYPAPVTRIHVNPPISYVGVGETFSIDVNVAEVVNLYGFEFKLSYNTTILDAVDVVIHPFLDEPTNASKREINDESGFVWVNVTSQPPAEEVNGSGTLASVIFQVAGLGECVLDLYDTDLNHLYAFPIDHSVEDGFYEGGMARVVSTESTLGSYAPSLAVDSAGNVHVAWHDETDLECGTDCDIFYKRYEIGVGWTLTEVVSTESTQTSAYPSLAVDPSGNVHVAWHDNTLDYGGSGTDWDIFYKKYEAGVGWTSTEVVSTESTSNSFYPSLAVDSAGNVHIAWHDETDYAGCGSDVDIFYKQSTGGLGWTNVTEVVSLNSTLDSYAPSLAVDSAGNVHVAWQDDTDYNASGTDSDIFYKRYEVGVGWDSAVVVSTESTNSSYAPSLAVDSAGNVHVAWQDDTDYNASGTDRDIFYKRYEIGVGWTLTEVVSTESNATSWGPSLAVDSGGDVHVVWDDRADSGNETDWAVFYKRYEVEVGWTLTQFVSTESPEHSWVASLAVDSYRNVHIAWHDETDYAGCGSDVDIFYRYLRVHFTRYPWLAFRCDPRRTGCTESPAPRKGEALWNYTTGGDVFSSPAVADGMVFVGSNDSNVYALDQHTRIQIWNFTTGDSVYSSPVVVDGRVYVGSDDDCVYCLDAASGTQIWNFTAGDDIFSSPAVAYGRVYVGSDDDCVYCLDALTGVHIWNYTAGGWMGSPAVVDGKVYVGSWDNHVYCLDAVTGVHLWNYTTGNLVESTPAVADGRVYVGSWDNHVYCLDAVTGVHLWNYTTGGDVFSSPAVADGKVYVGSFDNHVYCLNASNGVHLWNYTTGGDVFSSPAVADGKVYVGSFDNHVYCLNASTGAHIWNYTTGNEVWSSPAVADGKVYVGSFDDTVYALGGILRVPEEYPTVQEAVDAADPGDTIIVAAGIYYESVVINKTLTIIGGMGSSTTFEGGGSGIAVTISGDEASGSIVANVVITNWEQGIFIDNSSMCTIYDNIMHYMVDSAIALEGDNAANNFIGSNTIYSNSIAINLGVTSTSNTIYNNTLCQNTIALNLESGGNTIYANTISANDVGIRMTNSGGNVIYWNSFTSSTQVHIETPGYANVWDDGYPSGGNYWSDYEERYPDAEEYGDSGIWNTPYVIDEPYAFNVDNYPLINPVHEIALILVAPHKTVVCQGYCLKIDVTVENQGKGSETIELMLHADTIMVDTVANIFVASGNTATITLIWDTTGFAKGSYTISAQASPSQGEIDTTDNTYTDSPVLVTLVGDIDGDGEVNIFDLSTVALAFFTFVGHPGYDPYGDITDDGIVDMRDITLVAFHYGTSTSS